MKDAIRRALDKEAKRIRRRRRVAGPALGPQAEAQWEAEAMAMLRRGLEARHAELIAAGAVENPSAEPVCIDTLRARLADRLARLSVCGGPACRRAGRCRKRQPDCPAAPLVTGAKPAR